ncbi:MAG: hypothetical protein NTX75_01615 [Proteobacteria bacterium]|nr:hypothetical protein [Pseudomonadota bacterium]
MGKEQRYTTGVLKRRRAMLCITIMLIFACCLNFATAETINMPDYPDRLRLVVPNAATDEALPNGALTNVFLRFETPRKSKANDVGLNTATPFSDRKMCSNSGDIRAADKDGNVCKTMITAYNTTEV